MMKRTGVPEDEAIYYINLAELRIRSFLHLHKSAELDLYLLQTADVATLLYQLDTATKNSAETLGLTSLSVSEGGVSRSESGLSGSDIRETYETEIYNILASLETNGRAVRFL
jgi:hypothetical protein